MITFKVRKPTNFFQKTIGLIGYHKATPLLIKTRFGIHTFLLGFPIDVVVLDKENKIVQIKANIEPNRIFLWNPIFDSIIELPAGTIKNQKLKVGKILFLKFIL